ncbi:TrkH family potassium uptake protein [Phaeovulum sp.]|uniref:TrkH family potassium uptake protein n=1 Tax=Phaeovulum sp. TaxID=2934796 RepID=UPI0039E2F69A
MLDLRPVLHILGLILAVLGASMLAPMTIDLLTANRNWQTFFEAGVETMLTGTLLAIASRSPTPQGLSVRQAYLLTAGIWVVLPAFAALPFMQGAPYATLTDAYFEAVSGITTTGSSVFPGLGSLPPGVVLWRGMLNWMGGLGIAFVAMIFLPVMRIGGMQFFRTEGFDTLGKILPRARDIARALVVVYLGLTLLFTITYGALGMTTFEAIIHAMSTISTGGFSTSDASFAAFSGPAEYAGALFMLLSAMPFIRFAQLARGATRPIWLDTQIRGLLRWFCYATAAVVAWRVIRTEVGFEPALRETLFNLSSIMTGTGFGSADISTWGNFPVVVMFIVGMIGGCTGSSSGSLSVFRWQALGAAIRAAVQQLHSPHRLVMPRYDGKTLGDDVLNPLMMYFTGYILTLGTLSVAVSMTGVDMTSALFAIWTSLGNIGYALGPMTARTGTMIDFNDAATWVMTLAMLLGRLGLLAILVVFLPRFWRG